MTDYVVYKITHKESGRYYIGCTMLSKWETGYYWGGGRKIIKAIAKYGKAAFEREVLFNFDNAFDAFEKEKELVNNQDPLSYNIAGGGKYNVERAESTLAKVSKALKGKPAWNKGKPHSEETRERISKSLKGRKVWNKGKTHSEETRKKLSDIKTGTFATPEARKNMSLARKGVPLSQEHRKSIGLALKGKPKSPENREKMRQGWIKRKNRLAKEALA